MMNRFSRGWGWRGDEEEEVGYGEWGRGLLGGAEERRTVEKRTGKGGKERREGGRRDGE